MLVSCPGTSRSGSTVNLDLFHRAIGPAESTAKDQEKSLTATRRYSRHRAVLSTAENSHKEVDEEREGEYRETTWRREAEIGNTV